MFNMSTSEICSISKFLLTGTARAAKMQATGHRDGSLDETRERWKMDKEWFYGFFEQDYFRKTPEQIDTIIDKSVPQAEFLIDVLELSRIIGYWSCAVDMEDMP